MTFPARLCLTLTRILLPAWVGAATLFVVNGIRLITSGHFDSIARDHISLIRFPPYYLFGFLAVGGSIVLLWLSRGYPRKLALGLLVLALVMMVVDYFAVYAPLAAMITPPGRSRPPQFESYHRASMIVNAIHVGLCLVVALMISRPLRPLPAPAD